MKQHWGDRTYHHSALHDRSFAGRWSPCGTCSIWWSCWYFLHQIFWLFFLWCQSCCLKKKWCQCFVPFLVDPSLNIRNFFTEDACVIGVRRGRCRSSSVHFLHCKALQFDKLNAVWNHELQGNDKTTVNIWSHDNFMIISKYCMQMIIYIYTCLSVYLCNTYIYLFI